MNIESTNAFSHWGYVGVAVVGVVLFIITLTASVLLVRLVRRVLRATTDGAVGGTIIANIVRVVVWLVGVSLIVRWCFGFDLNVVWGALGIGGIALSLGMQNTVSNLIGGLQLSLSRDVAVGDWVVIGANAPAKVEDINWRITKLVDENGARFLVPNSVLNTTSVEVLTEAYVVPFALSLAADIDLPAAKERIVQIAYDELKGAGMLYEDKRPALSVLGSTVDSIDAQLKVYALHDYTQVQINNVVMPPVLAHLESIGGMAHCYSG